MKCPTCNHDPEDCYSADDVGDALPDMIQDALYEQSQRGGRKGGPARAAALTKEQLSAIGRKAALARWSRSKPAVEGG